MRELWRSLELLQLLMLIHLYVMTKTVVFLILNHMVSVKSTAAAATAVEKSNNMSFVFLCYFSVRFSYFLVSVGFSYGFEFLTSLTRTV